MFACSDLQAGIDEIYALTGVMPAKGGVHPGVGTRNALVSLDNHQYLEIIAPDPDQELSGTTGEVLLANGGSGIRGWAVACEDLSKVVDVAMTQQLGCRDIINMSRKTPEGLQLAWQLLFMRNAHLPFFIDWQGSPHPALSTPTGCQLSQFTVITQKPTPYREFLSALELDPAIAVIEGTDGFQAELETPRGSVILNAW